MQRCDYYVYSATDYIFPILLQLVTDLYICLSVRANLTEHSRYLNHYVEALRQVISQ
jgi:hypothetical protein